MKLLWMYLVLCSSLVQSFIVRSEGRGSWGRRALDAALRFAFLEHNVTWLDGQGDADLVVRSCYLEEPYWNHTIPYITWSSESRSVLLKDYPPICELTNYIAASQTLVGFSGHRSYYVPYAIDAPFVLPYLRIHEGGDRPYALAYISSNCIIEREHLFTLLRHKLGDEMAHGLGRCSHNRNGTLGQSWFVNGDVYKDYTFALIMENTYRSGYITEKITLAFRGGAIPIYWGSDTISGIFNPKAMIKVNPTFTEWPKLADSIIAMMKNQTLIRAMQNEPVFRDGIVSDYFKVDDWPPPRWIRDIGRHIRRSYHR